jgi:hypothetical protein
VNSRGQQPRGVADSRPWDRHRGIGQKGNTAVTHGRDTSQAVPDRSFRFNAIRTCCGRPEFDNHGWASRQYRLGGSLHALPSDIRESVPAASGFDELVQEA